jgi:hypothetical protein
MFNKKFDDPVLDDFRNFLYLVWKFLDLPDPTETQYEIAYWLQHGDGTANDRIGIEAGRGEGKSWITSAFVCWLLLRNPQERILVLSASGDRAKAFLLFCRKLIIEMPELQHLVPRADQVDTATGFEVDGALPDHAPSLKCLGVFGSLAGNRATVIICDDVENQKNSATLDQREKLLYAVLETESILKKETEGEERRIIYLGTPQSEDTIYNKLDPEVYKFRIWPSRIPKEEDIHIYRNCLAPSVYERAMMGEGQVPQYNDRGAPTDPQMFTHEELLKKEMAQGKSMFMLQFMLNTALSDQDRYPLKLSDLILMPVNSTVAPEVVTYGHDQIKTIPNLGFTGDRWLRPSFVDQQMKSYTGSVLAIDPSGRGADATTYVVIKILNGLLFCTTFGSLDGGYSNATLEHLALIAKKEQVNCVLVESNFGDGMFTKMLSPYVRKHHRCQIEEVRHSVQKEMRMIDTLEPVMNQHRLVFDERQVQAYIEKTLGDPNDDSLSYNLFYQMTRVTRDRGCLKHDDLLDVLAMAVNYWTEQLATSPEELKARDKQKREKKEMEDFMNNSWSPEVWGLEFSETAKRGTRRRKRVKAVK